MSPRDRAELERWVRSPSMPAALVARVRFVPSQRRLRVPPGRHQAERSYIDPNPLGALRPSRTAFCRLLPRLIRRSGATDPDHEYVADPPSTGAIATGGTHPPG
jgi:hypothetical protein